MKIPQVNFSRCGLLEEEAVDSDLLESGRLLYEAFKSTGFAYIYGSGISRKTVDGVNEVADSFFSQTLELKMKFCSKGIGVMCYDPLGSLKMDRNGTFDHQEGFRVAPYDEFSDWPDVPLFKDRIREFKDMCRLLLLRILKALGLGMGLKDPNIFANSHRQLNCKGNETVVKLIHYPPVPEATKLQENQMRISEHSDFGSITLLFHEDIEGLQVQTPSGEFVDVPYVPEAILLNVGDMMQFWSGGRLKSTVHRVVFPSDPVKRLLPRRTAAYFAVADDDTLLEELEFDGSEIPAKTPVEAVTVTEYLGRKFEAHYAYQNESVMGNSWEPKVG